MKLLGLDVYEHPSIPADEAWVVRDAGVKTLPAELRGRVRVPCILTGDLNLLKRTVAILRLTKTQTLNHRAAPPRRRAAASIIRA